MTRLDRLNPVTRIVMAVLLTVPLVITLDLVSSAVALGLVLVAALAAGVGVRTIAARVGVLALLGLVGAVSMALYGQPSGRVWFEWFLVRVSDGSLLLAAAVLLRVLVLGLSAMLLLGGVDPTDMADGLAQVARLPARFVLGALAGVRMLELLTEDWRTLALARRARGLGDTGRLRRWLSMAFSLLVLAIRRGTRMATAMEAKGFGGSGADAPRRTWARESRLGGADLVGVAVSLLIGAAAVAAALWCGTFFWVGS